MNPRDLLSIVQGVQAVIAMDYDDAQKVRLIRAIVELAQLEAL